jgi:hypothetical protein
VAWHLVRGGKPGPHEADEVIVGRTDRQFRQRRDVLQRRRLLVLLQDGEDAKGDFHRLDAPAGLSLLHLLLSAS